jgi:hypothetical protein
MYVYFSHLPGFCVLGFRECRHVGFSEAVTQFTSAASDRNWRPQPKCSDYSAMLRAKPYPRRKHLLFSFSCNSRHWTERDFVRQITTDNRQLRPALRRMNRLSSTCQHSSESYERMEMLILSRNLRCGSALVADRKNTTNTYIEPKARHPEVLRHTSFRPLNTNRWIDVGDNAAAFQRIH